MAWSSRRETTSLCQLQKSKIHCCRRSSHYTLRKDEQSCREVNGIFNYIGYMRSYLHIYTRTYFSHSLTPHTLRLFGNRMVRGGKKCILCCTTTKGSGMVYASCTYSMYNRWCVADRPKYTHFLSLIEEMPDRYGKFVAVRELKPPRVACKQRCVIFSYLFSQIRRNNCNAR